MIKLKSLLREEEVVKNKKTGNVYVVQKMDSTKHDKPTPAEIDKAKLSNNGQLPKGEPQSAQKPQNTAPTKPGQKLGSSDFKLSAEKKPDAMPKLKDLMPNADIKKTTSEKLTLKSVIASKSLEKAAQDANTFINKIKDDNLDKKLLSDTFQKILNGDELNDTEKELANDWISIRVGGGNDVGFYIAPQKAEFTNNQTRLSIKFNIPPKMENPENWADGFNEKVKNDYGVGLTTQTGSYVNKKDYTAPKTNPARKDVEFKSSKDGNVVTIEGIDYQKKSIPSVDNLISSFIKQGLTKVEAKDAAKKIITSLKRKNQMIDSLIKNGKVKIVDYGETNNNKNRKKTLNNCIQLTKSAIVKSISNFSGLTEDEIQQKYGPIFNKFDKLKSFAPINNPNYDSMSLEEKNNVETEYQNKLLDILQDIRRDDKLASGGPDIAEIFVFMKEIGNGKQAFLPAESNFATIDILSFSEQKTPPINATPEQLAEFYSNEFSANSISFIDSDGESIKVGPGGASAGPSKWENSTFSNPKTSEKLNNLMDTYNSTFGKYPPSKEAIDNAQKSYDDTKAHTKKVLISKGYSEKEAQKLIDDSEAKSRVNYEQTRKIYEKSLDSGEKLNKEFKRGLELYNKAGNLSELLFNADLESNNFGNVRFLESGKGKTSKISLEVLDGINNKCCVKFNPNPGELKIRKDPKSGRMSAGINVSFSTHITRCK